MAEARPLRIAFFADTFPDLSVTFIIDQIVGLLERGHDVEVYAQRPGRLDRVHPNVEAWKIQEKTRYVGVESLAGNKPAAVFGAFLRQPRRIPQFVRALPPWCRDSDGRSLRSFAAAVSFTDPLDADVVHCHFAPNGNVAARLQRWGLLHAPIVTTFHGYDMRQGVHTRGSVYAPLRERGARFLSISGYNRRLLEEWGFDPGRIVEHHVGIDVESFAFRERNRVEDRAIRILCVANLVAVKGHACLIDAIARLRVSHPELEFELRLVGEGDQRQGLEERVSDHGLADQVSFLGGLARESVKDELARADLFVLPSLAEATPVALMEAQASGLPVIATRVGAVHEVVPEGRSGVLVDAGDVDSLHAGFVDLSSAPVRWAEMGRAGRAHVEANYHLPRLIDQLEEIYRDVLLER